MSQTCSYTWAPDERSSSAVSATPSLLISATATPAPFAANSSGVARPMPLPPPTTMATLPLQSTSLPSWELLAELREIGGTFFQECLCALVELVGAVDEVDHLLAVLYRRPQLVAF